MSHYPADATDPHVRVMTLNLNWDSTSLDRRVHAAAADIIAAAPDVVCLQEVAALSDGTDAAAWLADACGMRVVVAAAHGPHPSCVHGVAILSRLEPVEAGHVLDLPDDGRYQRRAVAAALRAPSGRTVLAVTAHLAWGGTVEPKRVAEAVAIDQWAGELAGPDDVVVLTGDFNTLPGSDTLRFLTGLHGVAGCGAYWVDAWDVAGDGPGYTLSPANQWVADTAAMVGIARPELQPSRRIDYVMVRGWAYGRPGSPLTAEVTSTGPAGAHSVLASDHYGVTVDLWDPPTS